MTDLRQKVKDDRGLLKKIELVIPGFRGYRIREDLRIADSMLRLQVANSVRDNVLAKLEEVREICTREMEIDLMKDIGSVISSAKMAEAKIRHAEQGYSGISSAYRVDDDQLNQLYEYDLSLIDIITSAGNAAADAVFSADSGDFGKVKTNLKGVKTDLTELITQFGKRIEMMAGLGAL